jgi:hypothetical protein
MTTVDDAARPDIGHAADHWHRLALAGGALAGPMFVGASIAQGALRRGFSFSDHPPSALSTGGLGWIQMTNFVVTGALYLAATIALRRSLHGPGSTWGRGSSPSSVPLSP